MTTAANNNDNKTSETDDSGTQNVAPECAPGCACEKPNGKGSSKIKVAVCLIVLVAVVGILIFKSTNARQYASGLGKDGFSNPFATKGKGCGPNGCPPSGGGKAAAPCN